MGHLLGLSKNRLPQNPLVYDRWKGEVNAETTAFCRGTRRGQPSKPNQPWRHLPNIVHGSVCQSRITPERIEKLENKCTSTTIYYYFSMSVLRLYLLGC